LTARTGTEASPSLHWQVGEVSITRIAESCTPFDRAFLCPNADPATFDRHRTWLHPHFVTEDGRILLSIHALLIRSRGLNILVDTCLGEGFDFGVFPDAGRAFLDGLREAGLERRDVDVVLCTHLHYDHIGWNTMLEGKRRIPTFPNASYLFGKVEYEYWDGLQESQFPTTLADCVQPIVEAGLACFVEMDHSITDEVSLVASPGHTPGHVSVRIQSSDEEAFVTGDAVVHPVQWAEVEWGNPQVDHDIGQAVEVRRGLRDRYGETDTLIIGTHFAPPTAGYVRRGADGWWFEGLSASPSRAPREEVTMDANAPAARRSPSRSST
jgi:glyoxylase-like metal-dependent hydrolase (beta-lactamase superfamily II)